MEKKRYAAIICEYNPFHYGHLFQINSLKEDFDGIICIMSGNLVQRGEVAVADKYLRAKAAVMCGADLVVELPFPFCMLSARDFARAGVTIAAMLGCDALGFGCEDDFDLLRDISVLTDSISFKRELEEFIKNEKKLSAPKAFEKLVFLKLGEKAAAAVRKPNNILTLEYISAINNGNFPIIPYPVRRDMTLRSSSSIRREGSLEAVLTKLPPESAFVYKNLDKNSFPRSTENLSRYIIATLRRNTIKGQFYSTPSDLFNAMKTAAQTAGSFDALVRMCTNSLYTEARVRRSILSIVFGITPEDALRIPSYTMLLAASSEGCSFLKNRSNSEIPVITKPAHIKKQPLQIQNEFYRSAETDSIIALSAPVPEPGFTMKNTPFIKS